jgi:hypothetical protein
MQIIVDGDVSLFRGFPLSRHPLRLGELSGRYLSGDGIAGRDNKKAVNESIWLMKGVHAA